MARNSYVSSVRAMALGTPPMAWLCAAPWPVLSPPLTLEAVANAMAAVAIRTGPLGLAICGLFDNIGRLTTCAANFTAFLAGRWVAGLAAAALSIRGLATTQVVLRGALNRTGIGALIVGAGELAQPHRCTGRPHRDAGGRTHRRRLDALSRGRGAAGA